MDLGRDIHAKVCQDIADSLDNGRIDAVNNTRRFFEGFRFSSP
jgi:hypothetical protein